MPADPVLVLAWLVLAHLVADFVLQTDAIAIAKFSSGRRGMSGLLAHTVIVGLCMLPLALAYGLPGILVVGIVTVSHGLIDRGKILLTRRVEAAAIAEAHRSHEPAAPAASLGTAWTPIPAFLFVVDQAVHLAVLGLAWAIWLAPAAPTSGFADIVSGFLAGRDPGAFHGAVLTGVVVASLLIVNVRAAALFVATLVHPREAIMGADLPSTTTPARPAGYNLRLGRLEGRLEADPAPPVATPPPSPARVGLVVGVLERLLIVGLILGQAEAAVGLVVAAKTLARFRQLDDRAFAEYYLLGTLASVAVAVGSAVCAGAALASLG